MDTSVSLAKWQSGHCWSRYAGLLLLPNAGQHSKFITELTGSHTPNQQHNTQLIFKIKDSALTPALKFQKRDIHKHFFKSFGWEYFVLLCL